jgi:hypothetical protein
MGTMRNMGLWQTIGTLDLFGLPPRTMGTMANYGNFASSETTLTLNPNPKGKDL